MAKQAIVDCSICVWLKTLNNLPRRDACLNIAAIHSCAVFAGLAVALPIVCPKYQIASDADPN